MKNCPASLVLLLFMAWGVRDVRADALQDAQAAFAKADYSAAARAYETALSSNPPSAGLYYNLAQAQLKAGTRPEAALSLHRALMLDPRLTDARVALSELERSQGLSPATEDWRVRLAERTSLPAVMISGCVLFWLAAFLLLALFFKKARPFSWVAIIFLLLLGGAIFTAGLLADPKISDRRGGIIMAGDGVSLQAAPVDQSDAVAKLPAAAAVQILQRSGAWTYCQSSAGEKGWVPSSAVQAIVPAS